MPMTRSYGPPCCSATRRSAAQLGASRMAPLRLPSSSPETGVPRPQPASGSRRRSALLSPKRNRSRFTLDARDGGPHHTVVHLTWRATVSHCCDNDNRSKRYRSHPSVCDAKSEQGRAPMNMELSRRHFLKMAGVGAAGTSLGPSGSPAWRRPRPRPSGPTNSPTPRKPATPAPIARWRAASSCIRRATCGRVRRAEITHIEGDIDHPTNRGTLCPKGAALKDFVTRRDAA